jgi:hypothetical protein
VTELEQVTGRVLEAIPEIERKSDTRKTTVKTLVITLNTMDMV